MILLKVGDKNFALKNVSTPTAFVFNTFRVETLFNTLVQASKIIQNVFVQVLAAPSVTSQHAPPKLEETNASHGIPGGP